MLYIGLRDYAHFKELFAKRTTNNGKTIRQNQILLSYYKNAIKNHETFTEAKNVISMASLYAEVIRQVRKGTYNNLYKCNLGCEFGNFYSPEYETDKYKGLCEDGDISAIRYVRVSDGRVYKMKAGKFLKRIILSTEYGKKLDESTLLHILEVFTQKWQSMALEELGNFELIVNEDFQAIYDSGNYVDGADFHSCMTDEEQHYFYENSVSAKAASLWRNNEMYARCILFTDVIDQATGEKVVLAERQYSAEENELYKNLLINMLIKGEHIDGYKKIGAGCHDSRAFVSNKGEDWSDKEFKIRCWLEHGDTLSYQDSFKFYDRDTNWAYNHLNEAYTNDLGSTEREFEVYTEWDSVNEEYCEEVTTVYVWSDYRGYYREETCNTNRLDDFFEIDGDYYDEAEWSDYHYEYLPKNEAVWSDRMNDYLRKDCAVYSEFEMDYILGNDAIWDDKAEDYFSSNESLQAWRDNHLAQVA